MAASSKRGHPGGDQGLFHFKCRRCIILFRDSGHVRLGAAEVSVVEEAAGVEQHKSEVRSGVIFWSFEFATESGSIALR